MLEDVGRDERVEAARREALRREVDVLDAGADRAIDARGGDRGGRAARLDADDARTRETLLERRAENAGGAAQLQHAPGRALDHVEERGVDDVGVMRARLVLEIEAGLPRERGTLRRRGWGSVGHGRAQSVAYNRGCENT